MQKGPPCRAVYPGEPQGSHAEADPDSAALLCARGCPGDLEHLQAQAADPAPRLPRGMLLPHDLNMHTTGDFLESSWCEEQAPNEDVFQGTQ